ncbi:SDR family NAD(P)-dependent oxidoreductase [Halobaculum limi]|uniref:SDR family NAD(P)-dependent oxidoreductase n=1 Tax=Halobaculum limi TaxID=3031916 RepID=UPI0024064201|nr:SDR family NAD(P)-dependent oxidoreductase [Halobaculum sp. YSMS11]
MDTSETPEASEALEGSTAPAPGRPVVLLTGGTSGIGREAVQRLAESGATVLTVGRRADRGRRIAEEVTSETPGTVRFQPIDLETFAAVRDLAAWVREETDRLDALVHNAALSSQERYVTPNGVERTFAVNHLAPYLLTHELLGLLADTGDSRVVITASSVHRRGTLDFDDIGFERGYDGLDAYARSKLANVAFTLELAARLGDDERTQGVVANCVHPGFIPTTGLYRDVSWRAKLATRVVGAIPGIGTSVNEGARRLVEVVIDPEYATRTGEYVGDGGPEEPSEEARDPDVRYRLWRVSAELVGVDPNWP